MIELKNKDGEIVRYTGQMERFVVALLDISEGGGHAFTDDDAAKHLESVGLDEMSDAEFEAYKARVLQKRERRLQDQS